MTALVYAQVVGFEFTNYDDTAYVPDNAHVRDGFSFHGVGWAFTTYETANWYPLTWLSLMLDCQLFGPRAGAIHAVNALLNAADAVLLFLVLRRMTGRRWPSAAVAALFAVHPLHVESVAWVAERKDVLSTLFFLTTLFAYEGYVMKPGIGRWSLVFISMAAGLLCKPMLVTLPFVLLLLDYWPLRSTSRPLRLLIVEKLPLVVLSLAASVVTMIAQAKMGATKMIGDKVHLSLQLASAAIAYVKYLAMTFWPVDLAVFYPYDFHPRSSLVVASVALLAAVTLVAILLIRRAPYLAVGWFWYLGTLVPTIGIIQVGRSPLRTVTFIFRPSASLSQSSGLWWTYDVGQISNLPATWQIGNLPHAAVSSLRQCRARPLRLCCLWRTIKHRIGPIASRSFATRWPLPATIPSHAKTWEIRFYATTDLPKPRHNCGRCWKWIRQSSSEIRPAN